MPAPQALELPLSGQNDLSEPRAILVRERGADPWVVEHQGVLHYTQTTGSDIRIWTARSIEELQPSHPVVVWPACAGTAECSRNIWAPELHQFNGRWYIYFAADDGRSRKHRMFVLESVNGPLGPYVFRGKISAVASDNWAIDGTPFEFRGRLYFIWSGWPGRRNGRQNLYIGEMSNPWTISTERVMISTPTYPWESWINEGPEILIVREKLYLFFSANRSWSNDYCVGLLELNGSDPLCAGAWLKAPKPVFESTRESENPIYGPGHCSFFLDRRTGEDWLLYHVARHSGSGWDRQVRAQRLSIDGSGAPKLGRPLPLATQKFFSTTTVNVALRRPLRAPD